MKRDPQFIKEYRRFVIALSSRLFEIANQINAMAARLFDIANQVNGMAEGLWESLEDMKKEIAKKKSRKKKARKANPAGMEKCDEREFSA